MPIEIGTIVDLAVAKKVQEVDDGVAEVLRNRISDALDVMRAEVADKYFNAKAE